MKTINDVLYALENADGEVIKRQVLEYWAIEIITCCAENFECDMEFDGYDEEDNHKIEHPVLCRHSVLAVKQQIK